MRYLYNFVVNISRQLGSGLTGWQASHLMQVKSKLKGHSKRITGLAFSHLLNVLVSSGADAQVCKTRIAQTPLRSGCMDCVWALPVFWEGWCDWGLLLTEMDESFAYTQSFDYVMFSYACGAQIIGKNKGLNFCSFLREGHQQHNQIRVSSFIKTRHISWLYMRLNWQFLKQNN